MGKIAVPILGCFRSGTSMTIKILNISGIYSPKLT